MSHKKMWNEHAKRVRGFAKGDRSKWGETYLAVDRIVKAAVRYNNACGTRPGHHVPDSDRIQKAHVSLCRAVEAFEKETKK